MASTRVQYLCLLLLATAAARPPDAPASASRFDRWKVIGPGGGGRQMCLGVSPTDPGTALVRCDMLGSYLTRDGGHSWRMFNLGSAVAFFEFDPSDANVIYARAAGLFRSRDAGKTWTLLYPRPASLAGIAMPSDNAGQRLLTKDGPAPLVSALAVDPGDSRVLYAALVAEGATTLHVSADFGETWKKSAGLPTGAMRIYADPRSQKADRTLYVIGRDGLAVRRGGRWLRTERPPWAGALQDVSAGFPKSGGAPTVYAMTADALWVSLDGGANWRLSNRVGRAEPGVVSPDPRKRPAGLYAVAAGLNDPEVAYLSYAGLREGDDVFWGVARTSDAGKSWTYPWKESRRRPAPVTDSWLNTRFPFWSREPMELKVAASNPNICYGVGRGRTLRTTDGGRTWNALYSRKLPGGGYTTTGLDVTTCYGVHFDPFDQRRVFITYTDIGLFRSEDGGTSWNSSTAGVSRDWVNTTYWIEFDPARKGRMWAAMSHVHDLPRVKMWRGSPPADKGAVQWTSDYTGGVCRSEDGGRTWDISSRGLPRTSPTHVLLDPASPPDARTLYVAAFGRGVYKSTDDGQSWTLKNSGIRGREPFAWRLARDGRGTLYLVVARRSEDGSFGTADDGALYRSRDGAEHWEAVELPRGVNGPNGLAIDPGSPERLYLAAWGRSGPEAAVDGGIFLSEDAGRSWRNVLSKDQHVYDVTVDARDPRTLYACGFESTAWRSTDRGLNWSRIRGYNFKWGHRVIPDPVNPKMIYITTFGGSVWYGPAAGDPDALEDITTPGFYRPFVR